MNSRMEKYDNEFSNTPRRSDKNKDLYNDINKSEISKFKTNNNAKIINSGTKEIDLNKIRNYVQTLNNQDAQSNRRSLIEDKGLYNERKVDDEQTKDYDINSILEKARENREIDTEDNKYKKLRDTQFDILSKLKVFEDNEPNENEEQDFNTEEKTLIDLINTVADNKSKNDLLSELQEETVELMEENEELKEELEKTREQEKIKNIVSEEVTKELMKKDKKEERKVDDTFFTNSLSFSKEDFDGEEEENSSFGTKFGIFILIILIIAVILGILYFVLDINVIEYVKNYANNLINKFIK